MKPTDLDRMAFRERMIFLEDGRRFSAVMEGWQREDFAASDSGRYLHRYIERPRGHSKTGDAGTDIVTDMVLGPPGLQIFGAATDKDQAKLLHDDVAQKFEQHPALRRLVKITEHEIAMKGTKTRFRHLATDAPSSYGLRPDRIYVDELAEWTKRELWDALWTATGKRPGCRMTVITTAGWDKTSICWQVRENAERERDWYFSTRGQCASWISPAWLA